MDVMRLRKLVICSNSEFGFLLNKSNSDIFFMLLQLSKDEQKLNIYFFNIA